MVYFRPKGDEQTYRQAMAKELGAIQNILKHFVDGIDLWHNTAVASAFAPLDVSTWSKRCSDDTLPDPHVVIENYNFTLTLRHSVLLVAAGKRS